MLKPNLTLNTRLWFPSSENCVTCRKCSALEQKFYDDYTRKKSYSSVKVSATRMKNWIKLVFNLAIVVLLEWFFIDWYICGILASEREALLRDSLFAASNCKVCEATKNALFENVRCWSKLELFIWPSHQTMHSSKMWDIETITGFSFKL